MEFLESTNQTTLTSNRNLDPEVFQMVGGEWKSQDLMLMNELCVDFRHKLLDILSTSCQSSFIEARKLAEEGLLDILDRISSLSGSEDLPDAPSPSLFAFSPDENAQNVSSPATTDVVFDKMTIDRQSETALLRANYTPDIFQYLNDFDPTTAEDPGLTRSSTSAESGVTDQLPIPPHGIIGPKDLSLRSERDQSPGIGHPADYEMQGVSSDVSFIRALDSMGPFSGMPLFSEDSDNLNTAPDCLSFFDFDPLSEGGVFLRTSRSLSPQPNQSEEAVGGGKAPSGEMPPEADQPVGVAATPRSLSDINSRRIRTPHGGPASQVPSPINTAPSPEGPRETEMPTGVENVAITCEQRPSRRTTSPVSLGKQATSSARRTLTSRSSRGRSVPSLVSERHDIPQTQDASDSSEETGGEMGDIYAMSSTAWARYTPNHLPSAEKVLAAFNSQLGESKRPVALLLTRLLYAIGSPDAVEQLRHALSLARKNSFLPVSRGSNDLATTVHALDQLDSVTTLSHILRRYYLVRLLEHRTRLEQDHTTAKLAWKGSKRRLKYDCAKIELLKKGDKGALAVEVSPTSNVRPKYRSKSQALTDLMQMLYPGLEPVPEGNRSSQDCVYSRKLTKLRNRLSCARNWYQFEQTFRWGILALIPCAGRFSISIDQVEKLPSDTLKIFLTYLQEYRGPFLHRLSHALSKDLFDVLAQTDMTHVFQFEEVEENSFSDVLYDTDQLLELCMPVSQRTGLVTPDPTAAEISP
uniref:HYP n=1 Tax=Phialomyces arenicola TaxID=168477 RepID=A0A6H0XBD1_9EURO|nr:HYP [Phialomyces arenicola]